MGPPVVEWTLRVLHCPERDLIMRRFVVGAELRIGRLAASDVDVAIPDPKLSRRHATFSRVGGHLKVQDDGSSNGTHVNGKRIVSEGLRSGDVVRIGDTLLGLDQGPPGRADGESMLVGSDAAFVAARELAERVAPSDLSILILGETGTGKDVLARHIHARSGRRGRFVAVNCAALPAGLVEAALFGHKKGAFTGAAGENAGLFLEAQGGTLFLDEIGELEVANQAKLLRALDAGELVPVGGTRPIATDARVIAATNAELLAATGSGAFRADLYARLAGVIIRMPPLRARQCDILTLAERFLADRPERVERRLSVHAAERLLLHPWPHNVRELLATMRRLDLHLGDRAEVCRADVETVLEPPIAVPAARPARAGSKAPTREELVNELRAVRGNVARVAAQYRKDTKQVYRWLKSHGIDPKDYR